MIISDYSREIQEQALSHRGLADEKRGFSLKGIKLGKVGSILKSLAYNAIVGLVSFSAGDAIYNAVTTPKPSSGSGSTGSTSSTNPGSTNPGSTNPGTTNPGTTNPGTTNPGYGPGYTTYGPGPATPNTGYTTYTPTTGYTTDAPGSISQRAREERALNRRLPVDIFSESLTPIHVQRASLMVSSLP